MFSLHNNDSHQWDISELFSEISEEVSHSLDEQILNPGGTYYRTDWYHHARGIIEIFTPVQLSRETRHLASANRVRHFLSTVDDDAILSLFHRIIVKPRYIHQENRELSALYLPDKKYFIIYMGSENMLESNSRQFHHFLHEVYHQKPVEPYRFILHRKKGSSTTARELRSLSYTFSTLGY
jgi:hypothetical protein